MRSFDSSTMPFLNKTDFRTTSSTLAKWPPTSEPRTKGVTPLLITQSSALSATRFKASYSKLPSLGHKRYISQSTGYRVDQIESQIVQMCGSLNTLNKTLKDIKNDALKKKANLVHAFERTQETLQQMVGNLGSKVSQTKSSFQARSNSMNQTLEVLSAQSDTMKGKLWQISERVSRLQSTMGVYTGGDKYVI